MTGSEYYSGGGEKTVAKLVILEKYIEAYLSIMNDPDNWSGETWYVDTHAGTGFSEEFGVPIPGSTLRALAHNFDRYYFYEDDENHFELLCETIESEIGKELWRNLNPDEGPPRAGCEDPKIHIMNTDSNEGVVWLVDKASSHHHWFTFVDPEQFSVTLELMETLRRRGNMDILFNFQTEGFYRNASENADHSHEKVTEGLGEGWPTGATKDELVRYYQETVFEHYGWNARSRKMVSEGDNSWRYDLIFASESATADRIIGDIYGSPHLKNDITKEISKYRKQGGSGQQSIGALHVDSHDEDEDVEDDPQTGLGQF